MKPLIQFQLCRNPQANAHSCKRSLRKFTTFIALTTFFTVQLTPSPIFLYAGEPTATQGPQGLVPALPIDGEPVILEANAESPETSTEFLAPESPLSEAEAANHLFVDPNGNDSNDGSENSPLRTLAAALEQLTQNPCNGIILRGGVYEEGIDEGDIPSGTSWEDPVTIEAYAGEEVILRPTGGSNAVRFGDEDSYIVLDGITIDGQNVSSNTMRIEDAHHIRVQYSKIMNAGGYYGVYVRDSSYNELISLDVHGNANYGVYFKNAHDNVLQDSLVHDNGSFGIRLRSDSSNNLIQGNIVWGNDNDGIRLYDGTWGNEVTGNDVYINDGTKIRDDGDNNVHDNNLIDEHAPDPMPTIERPDEGPQPPLAPVLNPLPDQEPGDLTASWSASEGTAIYHVQFATDAAFTNIIHEGFPIDPTETVNLGEGAYYVRVRASADTQLEVGPVSEWSSAESVVLAVVAPDVPVLNPIPRAVPGDMSVSWSAPQGVAIYHMQVATDAGFTNVIHDGFPIDPTETIHLSQTGDYFVRVRASADLQLEVGPVSDWSESLPLTVQEFSTSLARDSVNNQDTIQVTDENNNVIFEHTYDAFYAVDVASVAGPYLVVDLSVLNPDGARIEIFDLRTEPPSHVPLHVLGEVALTGLQVDLAHVLTVQGTVIEQTGTSTTTLQATQVLSVDYQPFEIHSPSGRPFGDINLSGFGLALDENGHLETVKISPQGDAETQVLNASADALTFQSLGTDRGFGIQLLTSDLSGESSLIFAVSGDVTNTDPDQIRIELVSMDPTSPELSLGERTRKDSVLLNVNPGLTMYELPLNQFTNVNLQNMVYLNAVNPHNEMATYSLQVSPGDPITFLQPVLDSFLDQEPGDVIATWPAVSGAVIYHVQVATDSTFTNIIHEGFPIDPTETVNLAEGVYYFRVRGSANTQVEVGPVSQWSNTENIALAVAVPDAPILDPIAEGEPGGVTANWSAVSGAAIYHMQVATDASFSNIVHEGFPVNPTETVNLGEGTYFARVRASASLQVEVGPVSDWSNTESVTLAPPAPDAPVLNPISDGEPGDVVATWSQVPDAAIYHIQVSTDANFTNVIQEGFPSDPTETVNLGEGTYFVRVRASADVQLEVGPVSDWSNTESVVLAVAPLPEENAIYVSPTGSDSNDGSINSPYQTIAEAVGHLLPGMTLIIRGGVYDELITSGSIPSGTDWTNPVTVKAHPDEAVILRPTSGSQVGIFTSGEHHIVIDGITIDAQHVSYHGVRIGNAHHIRLQNVEVMNARKIGVYLRGNSSTNNELLNLNVHNNGTHGIYLKDADYNVVKDSLSYDNAKYGIRVRDDAENNLIQGNVVWGNGYGGIRLYSDTYTNEVTGNQLYRNNGTPLRNDNSSNSVHDNEIIDEDAPNTCLIFGINC